MRRRTVVLTLLSLLTSLAAVVVPGAPPAAAETDFRNWSVTIHGTYGDMRWTPRNSELQFAELDSQEFVRVIVLDDAPEPEVLMSLGFSTEDGAGKNMAMGYYGYAQRYPFNDPGRPGIEVGHLGFCNDQSGDFEVREIKREAGWITRLWITFTRFCDGHSPAFGEIRLGYPKTAYDVAPRVVRWPSDFGGNRVGDSSFDVPVRVRRTSDKAVEVTSVAVIGRHAADFPIRHGSCDGPVSRSGCVVRVGFAPRGPGPRHATLRVRTTAGTTVTSLDGSGAVGESSWVVDVDFDDPWEVDEHYDLPVSSSIGGPYGTRSAATGPSDDWRTWNTTFSLNPAATRFVEGGHYVWYADGSELAVSLGRGNQGCEEDAGQLDVIDLGFTGPDEELSQLEAGLAVHCKSSVPYTVNAQIKYHDRDDETAPGRVREPRAVRDGGRVALRWANPTAPDLAGVIVRWYPGRTAPGAPDAGRAVYFGTGNHAAFWAPRRKSVAVAVWAYDETGNVSRRRTLVLDP